MKNKFIISAILCSALCSTLFSTAYATKARGAAMASSIHLVGTETVYTSPYHIMALDNFIALESGLTSATSTTDGAEGSALKSLNADSKLFLSIGHLDESAQSQRKFMNGWLGLTGITAYKTQQNPIEAIYNLKMGTTIWGIGGYYSSYNDKKTASSPSESSAGVRLAASYGDLKWKANIGLLNKAMNSAGAELVNDMYFNLGLRYSQKNMRYGLDITTWNAAQTLTGTTTDSHSFQDIIVRAVEVNKTDVGEYFMGAGLQQTTVVNNKMIDKKMVRTAMPIILGAEAKANDWLVVRGSITQTVLVAQSKDEVNYPVAAFTGATGATSDFTAEANNTVVAAGVGLMFNKIQLDATLKGLTGTVASQNINGTDLLAQVSAVYKY